jgi:acetoin utilization deacetylase AcuC-like enzyme
VLTAQAHELVTRSALRDVLVVLPLMPAPQDALLAVHAPAYLERLREASAGGSCDGDYAPVTPATWDAARLTAGGLVAAVDDRADWCLCLQAAALENGAVVALSVCAEQQCGRGGRHGLASGTRRNG